MSHTPGPWKAGQRIAGNGWGVWCTENWYGVLDNTAPGIDAEANARLIAAAPDLLAACEAVLADHEERKFIYPGAPEENPNRVRVMQLLRAAIARARGV